MPSVSKKQHNLMEAVAHNKEFAKKVGIPQSVGKDFAAADAIRDQIASLGIVIEDTAQGPRWSIER